MTVKFVDWKSSDSDFHWHTLIHVEICLLSKTIPFVKIVKLSGHFGYGFHCQTVLFGEVVEEIAIISITAYTFILFIVFFCQKLIFNLGFIKKLQ